MWQIDTCYMYAVVVLVWMITEPATPPPPAPTTQSECKIAVAWCVSLDICPLVAQIKAGMCMPSLP